MRLCRISAVMASATKVTPAPDTPQRVRSRCAVREWGMMQDGRPQGRRFVLCHAGKDATEGKTGRRQAAALPFPCQGRPLGQMTNRVAMRWLSYEAHLAPQTPLALFRRKYFEFKKRTRLKRLAQELRKQLYL